MKGTFILVLFLYGLTVNSQSRSEQIAFDYFFSDIFSKEYSEEICKIRFSGFTEKEVTNYGHYKPCFKDDEFNFENSANYGAIVELSTNNVNSKIKFKKRKTKFRIYVLNAFEKEKYNIVQVEFTKNNEYTDAYYLKVNKNGKVEKWCKSGVVW